MVVLLPWFAIKWRYGLLHFVFCDQLSTCGLGCIVYSLRDVQRKRYKDI